MIPVARIAKLDESKSPIFEVFPFVKFTSHSTPHFQTFAGEKRLVDGSVRRYFEGDEIVTRGVIAADSQEFEQFILEYSKSLDAHLSSDAFSDVEKRAFLISKLLRSGMASSNHQSNRAIISRWLTIRSKNSFQLQEISSRDRISTKLLLEDLVGTGIQGFYRQVQKVDLENWGLPQAALQWDQESKEFVVQENLPNSEFLYVSMLSFAMSTTLPLSFAIKFDWEIGRPKLLVFREERRGKTSKIGEFAPQLGTKDVDIFAQASEKRQNAPEFVQTIARFSAPILNFLNSLLGLNIQENNDYQLVDIFNAELYCDTSRQSLDLFEKAVPIYVKSKFGSYPNLFLFSACMTGQARVLDEHDESKSIDILMNSFLEILKFRITYEGSRDPRSRLANLFFHMFPQISLNDQKRFETCLEMAERFSESNCKSFVLNLIRSASAHHFLGFLNQQAEILHFDELVEMQLSLISKLADARNRSRKNSHSKSISEMHDGLYNTYGAER